VHGVVLVQTVKDGSLLGGMGKDGVGLVLRGVADSGLGVVRGQDVERGTVGGLGFHDDRSSASGKKRVGTEGSYSY